MKTIPLNCLFTVEYGNKFDLNKMQSSVAGKRIGFVGRSANRHGIAAFVQEVDSIKPYSAGLITVALGGAILSSFIQEYPFYTAQNVAVLSPLNEMSFGEKLFYCLAIKHNKFRYSTFGREANRTLRELPVPDIASIPQIFRKAKEPILSEFGVTWA